MLCSRAAGDCGIPTVADEATFNLPPILNMSAIPDQADFNPGGAWGAGAWGRLGARGGLAVACAACSLQQAAAGGQGCCPRLQPP